jgi:hypothetical protein
MSAWYNWRRRYRCRRLSEGFEKSSNAFFIRFGRCASNWFSCRYRSSHFIFGILACFPDFARCSCQQLEQQCDRDQQKEKQIFEMSGQHINSLKCRSVSALKRVLSPITIHYSRSFRARLVAGGNRFAHRRIRLNIFHSDVIHYP